MQVKVYEVKPEGFEVEVEVAGCYIEVDGQFLLLQSGPEKAEAGAWGLPGGKLSPGEGAYHAAVRELKEETGIEVNLDFVHELGCLYVEKPGIVFAFYLFQVIAIEKPEVKLSSEHAAYCWVSFDELDELPLMAAGKEVLTKISRWV